MKNSRFFLSIITFFGLIFRLLSLREKTFWFDEAISWAFAKQSLGQMLTATAADNHPPFYYFLLHFWLKLGQGETFLRLPSIIFGLASICLVYLIGKKLFDEKTGILTSLLLAFSPLHIYFSTETRMYSLWTMLILFALNSYLKILKNPKKSDYLLFTIYCLFSLYTHYFTLLFLLTLDLFLILKLKKYQKQFKNLIFCQLTAGLLFLPWLSFTLASPHPQSWGLPPAIGLPATFLSFILGGVGTISLKTYFATSTPLAIKGLFMFTFLVFVGLFLLGVSAKIEKEKKLLLLLFFMPILAMAAVSLLKPIYSPRLFIITSVPFYLFVALGFKRFKKSFRVFSKILVIGLLILTSFSQNFYSPFKPQTIKEAATFIKKNSPSPPSIIHTDILTFYSFSYYFRNQKASQFLVFPSGLTQITTDIIGGSPIALEEAIKGNHPFWSITFIWDEKTWQFKEKQPQLKKDFKYDLVKTINDLEIFYYQPLIK